jgi:hypothetical protein
MADSRQKGRPGRDRGASHPRRRLANSRRTWLRHASRMCSVVLRG